MNQLTIIVSLLLIVSTFAAPQQKITALKQSEENFKLIILHNNDMHARFEQTNMLSSRCKEQDEVNQKCYGGFARVAHEVREYRRRAKLGEIPSVLYLNAGDTYTGENCSSQFV
jgi:2',3'-cyclic-nucleotide 2'-phosphodiesterase (5'-nucleotidase family)